MKTVPPNFLPDGHERHRELIRREVLVEHAERLAMARWWERWRVYREVEREVARRCEREAPPGALY